jgi:hypothetical protein
VEFDSKNRMRKYGVAQAEATATVTETEISNFRFEIGETEKAKPNADPSP